MENICNTLVNTKDVWVYVSADMENINGESLGGTKHWRDIGEICMMWKSRCNEQKYMW